MNKPPKKPMGQPDKRTDDSVIEPTPSSDAAQIAPANTESVSKLHPDDVMAFTDAELDETLKVLRAENRRRESEREASRPRTGSKVRILNGRPRYLGKVGTAVIVRRSRCFVSVPDIASPAYVLISDLELLER
jgi:hypothetical protein